MKSISLNIKINKLVVLAVVTSSMLVLTACQKGEISELKSAAKSIEALEYQEAIDLLSQDLDALSENKEALRLVGIAYVGLGDYSHAIEYFEKALHTSNGMVKKIDYDINYYLATAYFKSGNKEEALKIYENILAMNPKEVDALYLSGVMYAERDNLELARQRFDEAIKLSPENYEMLIRIYQILLDGGYKEIGNTYLTNAMANATKKMTNYEKGQISFYLEDYESARTYLERAKDEEGEAAVLFLGKTYETLGDISYAVSVYSSYVNTSEGAGSAKILNQMGMCKMNMEDYQGALAAFQQGINLPNNPLLQTMKINEIAAYEYMGDFSKAGELADNYLRQYPDDASMKREAQFLKTRYVQDVLENIDAAGNEATN